MSLPYLHPYLGLSNGLNTLHAAGGPGGAVGGWVELGRTTLGGTSTSITVSGLSNKRYLMVLSDLRSSVTLFPAYRLNSDTGSNYASRYSSNGGADGSDTSGTAMYTSGDSNPLEFNVQYYANYASKEKLLINHSVWGASGAGTAPSRRETVNKHAQTSNPISAITTFSQGGQNYNANSELVVLGYDPADSHTNNFWEELASVDLSGGAANNINSGTISAKKYLWLQLFVEGKPLEIRLTFNSDTASNYAQRTSFNGGADSTATSQSHLAFQGATDFDAGGFYNIFVINNTSQEKLVIGHGVQGYTPGAGTAPEARGEFTGKWVNTSNQITEIDFDRGGETGQMGTNTILKVWGAD